MIFHDSAEYDKLEENICDLFRACGFNKNVATQAAKTVKWIYLAYDKAQKCHESDDLNDEESYYKNARLLAKEINKILITEYDNRLLIDMVYNWRHGKKMKTASIIFRDWLQKLGIEHFPQAFLCTYFQIRAAQNHDRKDIENFRAYVEKVWKIVILTCGKENKIPIIF